MNQCHPQKAAMHTSLEEDAVQVAWSSAAGSAWSNASPKQFWEEFSEEISGCSGITRVTDEITDEYDEGIQSIEDVINDDNIALTFSW